MNIVHYSCKPGIDLVPKKDQDELRQKLMEIFGSSNYATYYNKINDYRNIPWHLKEAIEGLFKEFDVEPDKIWKIWNEKSNQTAD